MLETFFFPSFFLSFGEVNGIKCFLGTQDDDCRYGLFLLRNACLSIPHPLALSIVPRINVIQTHKNTIKYPVRSRFVSLLSHTYLLQLSFLR